MNEDVAQLARHLLDNGLDALSAREQRVILHIAKRLHVTQNVNIVMSRRQTFGEGLADKVARLGGSWTFIIVFSGLLVAWAILNTVVLTSLNAAFDPYPFIFLNLILSMVAALQAPVILMSQNRQAARDRIAAGLDYEINLKAEVEIMSLHDKLDGLRVEHLEVMIGDQSRRIEELSAMMVSGTTSRSRR